MSNLSRHFYPTSTTRDWIVLTADARQAVRTAGASAGALVITVPLAGAGVLWTDTHPDVRDAVLAWLEQSTQSCERSIVNRRRESLSLAARVQATLLGRSLTVPIVDGELACASDSELVLIDCDPRATRREVHMVVLSAGGAAPAAQGGSPPGGMHGP